jgi:hypothetical protein
MERKAITRLIPRECKAVIKANGGYLEHLHLSHLADALIQSDLQIGKSVC